MTDNEFLLQDRIQKIQQIISQYGEENFYLSFSGGKDSTVLSWLLDKALPDNKIPRVFADTGIELNMIHDFVLDMAKHDNRVVIIKPTVPIKQMLEAEGYPFKSKEHSHYLAVYKRMGEKSLTYKRYLYPSKERERYKCPDCLRYQFTDEFTLKVSDKCCTRLKKDPIHKWQKENQKPYGIVGIMPTEGGNETLLNVSLSQVRS